EHRKGAVRRPLRPGRQPARRRCRDGCGLPVGAIAAADADGGAAEDQVRVHEEILEAGIGHVLVGTAADRCPGPARPGLPRAPRPIGTLRNPAAPRLLAEDPAVLAEAE